MQRPKVIVPLLTPLTRDSALQLSAVPKLVDFFAAAGVDALWIAGTTSEGPLLSALERRKLTEAALETAGSRIGVTLQVGCASTAETLELASFARDAGASSVACVTPYYYALSEAELARHYRAVAAAADPLPLYLYTIPGRAGNAISVSLARELIQVQNVKGIKDSTGSITMLLDYLEVGGLEVYSGSDPFAPPALLAGAAGLVSGLANVLPELYVGLAAAHASGAAGEFITFYRAILAASQALLQGSNFSLLKALLSRRIGQEIGWGRAPLPPLGEGMLETSLARLRSALRATPLADQSWLES